MDRDEFDRTLELIYDVAVTPSLWPELLGRLGTALHCHFGGMVTSSANRELFQGLAIGVDRDAHQNFLGRFHRHSPLVRNTAPRLGQVHESRLIMARAAFERTEMYQAFFRPHDMGEGIRLTIWQTELGQQTISLVRSWHRGPFDAVELAWARGLMPHLQRMAMVGRHLRGAELLARSAYEALNRLPQTVLLFDRNGRLVFANTAGEALLRSGDGIGIHRGNLTAADRTSLRQLEALISRAAQTRSVAGAMRIARPSGQPAFATVIMPIGRDRLDALLMPGDPAVMVCIANPGSRHNPRPSALAQLFGLTGAEADLAANLLAGSDLREIAESSGRSVNTMRNLLARLMAKTEVGRQTDLIRLLGGLPVGLPET